MLKLTLTQLKYISGSLHIFPHDSFPLSELRIGGKVVPGKSNIWTGAQ